MASADYDARYLRGIDHFNRGDYFESHEVWEALWIDTEGPDREFYQGLIQAAVCLHHLGNGNRHGAEKLLATSRSHLRPFEPMHRGLDVRGLLEQVDRYCAQTYSSPSLTADRLPPPRIHLDPPPRLSR